MATTHQPSIQKAEGFGDQAKDMASQAGAKAKEIGSNVAQKAGDVASFVGKKADDATSAVGSGMKSLAGTIREHTPDQGVLGTASSAVSNTLDAGGRYLEASGLSGIGDDMMNLIRRNPIPALFVGIGIGFLLAKAISSRN